MLNRYGADDGAVLFVNLVDKKNEQGTLGDILDENLKAVSSERTRMRRYEGNPLHESPADTEAATLVGHPSISRARNKRGGAFRSKTTAPADEAQREIVTDEVDLSQGELTGLANRLRHVWFDFHHEVRGA